MNENVKTSYKQTIASALVESIKSSRENHDAGLNRFAIEIEDISPLTWLGFQNDPVKIYFSDRDDNFQQASTGIAKVFNDKNCNSFDDAVDAIDLSLASCDADIKFFGGAGFDFNKPPSGSWDCFPRYHFSVPKFGIRRENEKTFFAYNVELTQTQNAETMIEDFQRCFDDLIFENDSPPQRSDAIDILKRTDLPDKDQWNANVSNLTAENIQKVVLSRRSTLELSSSPNPIDILSRVKDKNIKTYDFCFQLNEANAFIGCSPERLFKKRGKDIYSEALAGTRLKGAGPIEQKQFHKELTESQKEQQEHDYVFDEVKGCLNEICSQMQVTGQRDVVLLSYLQHFCSRFEGVLKDGISNKDIINSLHPTAAVNGFPRLSAAREIDKYEQFSRGWFAGPVGWIDRQNADFAVAIRSALVKKKQISLFAGAGIVKSSDPDLEWQETENKMKQFFDVIG